MDIFYLKNTYTAYKEEIKLIESQEGSRRLEETHKLVFHSVKITEFFWPLTFDFNEYLHFFKTKMYQICKIDISGCQMWLKLNFC